MRGTCKGPPTRELASGPAKHIVTHLGLAVSLYFDQPRGMSSTRMVLTRDCIGERRGQRHVSMEAGGGGEGVVPRQQGKHTASGRVPRTRRGPR